MLKKDAVAIVGGLSKPSKMPGKAIGLPAKACKVGSKLHLIENSVCADCYALKGQYRFSNVQAAQYRRLAAIDNPDWENAMITLLQGEPWFRWHDSGDIQSIDHLLRIVAVCERTPETSHWLPTREKAIIKRYLAAGLRFPGNLTVRISDAMIDQEKGTEIDGCVTSGVTTQGNHTCQAYAQGGECGTCRACWNPEVKRVTYPKH